MKSGLLLMFSLILVGCSSSGPIVQHPKITDKAKISADVAYCESQAKTILAQQSQKGAGAKGALRGAVKGAAGAAVGSAIYGGNSYDNKRAAKYGSGLGAAAGVAGARKQKEGVKRNIQADCLNQKGYKIYGWN